jgi:hypothetical protein
MERLPSSGASFERRSPTLTVRENPLVLEPVTRDPFIDEFGRGAARVPSSQSVLVRESLLRLGDREERR